MCSCSIFYIFYRIWQNAHVFPWVQRDAMETMANAVVLETHIREQWENASILARSARRKLSSYTVDHLDVIKKKIRKTWTFVVRMSIFFSLTASELNKGCCPCLKNILAWFARSSEQIKDWYLPRFLAKLSNWKICPNFRPWKFLGGSCPPSPSPSS